MEDRSAAVHQFRTAILPLKPEYSRRPTSFPPAPLALGPVFLVAADTGLGYTALVNTEALWDVLLAVLYICMR
ncbi:hypothetical protein [Nitrososphaera sp.]|uniref:hypothetical protein n=1 Tax=Nitrososphaera sp. TaxID=1971748 RepID=UPI00307EAB77